MEPTRRTVWQRPLDKLWDDVGRTLDAVREGLLGAAEIARLLSEAEVRFAVADLGKPLCWVPARERFDFWETEVKQRLVAPEAVSNDLRPEEFPGGYCYVASEWRIGSGPSVILLEKRSLTRT